MNIDNYLNVASLALAVAALVPVLMPGQRHRFWTITVLGLCLVVFVAGYQTMKSFEERGLVEATKEEFVFILGQKPNGQTFEELSNRGFYQTHEIANAAIDELVRSKRITHEQLDTKDGLGNSYRIRRYLLAKSD
jgi:hypothetical protein